MNFNQLRYILAIDKFRSFSKAAEFCHIAQSTLSKEVQKLEKQYDIVLFDRSRLPVVPTIKGEELLNQARKILDDQEVFENIAKQKENTLLEGTFRLGVHHGLAPYILPLFLPSFAKKNPRLTIVVSESDQKQMDEQLYTGELDGCIVIHPFFKDGYYETRIFEEAFVLYVDENNPLRNYSAIAPEDVPFDQLLIHEDIRNELLDGRWGSGLGMEKRNNIVYQSGSLETIRKVIDLHGGITLLPEISCIYMGERRKKLTIPLLSNSFKRTISFIAPRGFHKNRIIKSLVSEIRTQVGKKLF